MNNKQLRDVSKRISSYSLPRRKETKEFTGFKYIHYGDIHTKVANIIIEDDNLPNIEVGQYEILQKYDIVVADASEDYQGIGQPAIVLFEPRNNIVAGLHTYAIRPDLEKVDALYLFYLIKSQKFKRYGYKVGTGMKVFGINVDNFMNFSHTYPSKEKQTQIGIFFKELDELIELQQNTITKLEEVKKGFINTLFPSKGSMKPRIRLSGSNQSWNTKMLGELVSIATGKLNANAMSKNGEYDFYTSGISKYKIDTYSFVGPAITIAGNGATVGYMHLADGKFDAYQRTYVLNDIKADRLFLFYEIKNKLPRKIHEESRTGNIPYIVMDMVSKLSLKVPDVKTQKNIGSFMNHLDCLIDLENKELKLLQEMKKGFLQKMFV